MASSGQPFANSIGNAAVSETAQQAIASLDLLSVLQAAVALYQVRDGSALCLLLQYSRDMTTLTRVC